MAAQNISSNLINRLVSVDQDVKDLYDDHIETYGELLVFVFMGELSHWFIELYKRWHVTKKARDRLKWSRLLEELELALASGNEEVDEIVSVGFLENLGNAGDLEEQIASRLPPMLRSSYDQVRWA